MKSIKQCFLICTLLTISMLAGCNWSSQDELAETCNKSESVPTSPINDRGSEGVHGSGDAKYAFENESYPRDVLSAFEQLCSGKTSSYLGQLLSCEINEEQHLTLTVQEVAENPEWAAGALVDEPFLYPKDAVHSLTFQDDTWVVIDSTNGGTVVAATETEALQEYFMQFTQSGTEQPAPYIHIFLSDNNLVALVEGVWP